MKQILQNLKNGVTEIVEIPTPQLKHGHLLIQTQASVVSVGTEKMLIGFGKANIFNKVRQQPDRVRQVLEKIKTDGVLPTLTAVRSKLDQPIPLGYSNAGVVIAVGGGVKDFVVGDRVVSNGYHAEIISVPQNLCVKIPENVDTESAAFTVIAAIGLQGIRLASPTLGESFVVTGLGLIGLLTIQLLIAQGCRVLGIDYDSKKLELAKQYGAKVVNLSKGEDPISAAHIFSNGRGVDGVIITASSKSNEPVHQAAKMCRKRARIVLVGVVGLELSRADFYEKELSFQVSCSYGPGRYDFSYEEKGNDYPIGFVRWTEQRNFEAILDLFSSNKLSVQSIISHRFRFEQSEEAYQLLSNGKPSLGIVLNYSILKTIELMLKDHTIKMNVEESIINNSLVPLVIGMIGSGNFSNQILLPVIKKMNVQLKNIASSGGINGVHVGKRFGFLETTTNVDEIIQDPQINTVFITTRHNSHANFVKDAINAGKHVFVEKPLCLTRQELNSIEQLKKDKVLMVGFNRRFAPHSLKMKKLLDSVLEPKTMIMTVNAGVIPDDHWTQDNDVGGGRIIGEACHYIDLLRYLVGHPMINIKATMIGASSGISIREDKMSITLSFADGSMATIHYFSNGHKSFPKERLEVFTASRILALDNFKVLTGYGWPGFKKMKLWSQDKGHYNGVQAFVNAVKQGTGNPIPLNELFEVTRACFDILDDVKQNTQ